MRIVSVSLWRSIKKLAAVKSIRNSDIYIDSNNIKISDTNR